MTTDPNTVAPRVNRDITVEQVTPVAPEPAPVLGRLHALTRKGYVADLGTKADTDMVVLRHAARAPDLVLHGDGVIEGFDGRRPRYKRMIDPPARIGTHSASEELRFMRFLDSIPAASLRDRTRRWRHRYLYFPAALAIAWSACVLLTGLIVGG